MSGAVDRARAAARVARDAGAIALDFYRRRASLVAELKSGPADYVSRADREVEQAIRGALAHAFPGEPFLGEETAASFAGGLDGAWVVDPIDGTHNFLRGVPYWNVAIAYVEQGRAIAAATYDPVHDELFHAAQGSGAHCASPAGEERLRTSPRDSLRGAYVALGHHDRQPEPRYLAIRRELMTAGAAMRNFGSAALQLAHVAQGRLDAFVELELSAWDAIGGLLMVEEAGGFAAPFHPTAAAGKAACIACAPGIAPALLALTDLSSHDADA